METKLNLNLVSEEELNLGLHEGGGSGSNNYNDLFNKPQIGGVILQGNKTLEDLGLAGYLVDYGKVYCHTKAEWAVMTELLSEKGAIYVYTDEYEDGNTYIPAIKIGDGLAYVVDLPFIDKKYAQHINNTQIHITAEDRAKWDNKVTCYASGERVIFTKENIS